MCIFKKISFLSSAALAFLFALSATPLHGIKNKESFTPRPEIFSQSADIDYPGLQTHIHYRFKDTDLLRDALHPMLPKSLNSSEQQFDQLEFLGDAVLGLIIRKRLIELFPNEDRGHLAQIYSLLTQNKTLTETFLWNLDIERYLPFPGLQTEYEICNVAEALIGAIHKDDAQNGLKNATTFVLRLLDDDVFNIKISEYSGKKGIVFTPKMLPEQEVAIRAVCTSARVAAQNPKSLLNEVLLKIFDDRPEYTTSLVKANDGRILFSSNVIGAQIGKKINGLGNTVLESEENAARNALNVLAQATLYDIKEPKNSGNNFRYQMSEIVKLLGITLITSPCIGFSDPFGHDIIVDGFVVGEGEGSAKHKAEEEAAQGACYFLVRREEERQRIRQEIRLSELKQKRAALVIASQPLPSAILPAAVPVEPSSLKEPAKPNACAPLPIVAETIHITATKVLPRPPVVKKGCAPKASPLSDEGAKVKKTSSSSPQNKKNAVPPNSAAKQAKVVTSTKAQSSKKEG